MIGVEDYLSFLSDDYLADYVALGGAAVKFVVPRDDRAASSFVAGFVTAAGAAAYTVATVDAAETRVHLIEQVFFDVARQVEWDGLAMVSAIRAAGTAGYPTPEGESPSIERLAAHHQVDPRELRRDLDRALQTQVQRDYAMISEFRTAMMRLCQAQLHSGQMSDAEHTAVVEWLRGDLRQVSALRSALIFRRIGRQNARQLLFSLAHWCAVNGHSGLALLLDIRRLGFARRPSPEERHGHYYTKAALLDAYEVLRQLVDNTDEMSHLVVVVLASPAFLTDTGRGLDAYQALKLRVFDEVRDVERDNPLSSLVRLGAS